MCFCLQAFSFFPLKTVHLHLFVRFLPLFPGIFSFPRLVFLPSLCRLSSSMTVFRYSFSSSVLVFFLSLSYSSGLLMFYLSVSVYQLHSFLLLFLLFCFPLLMSFFHFSLPNSLLRSSYVCSPIYFPSLHFSSASFCLSSPSIYCISSIILRSLAVLS